MVPSSKILETARREAVDLIGLSGLITPSLDEMAFVAGELEREGFRVPLLIGGATTSQLHTAVRIAPKYSGAVVHVTDASRAVGVATSLASAEQREGYAAGVRERYETLRREREEQTRGERLLPYRDALRNRLTLDWGATPPPVPGFLGVRTFDRYPLADLVERIDWTPFFQSWELKGRFPDILSAPETGEAATPLYRDARALLHRIVKDGLLTARGVVGFFPASSVGDDIEVYADESRRTARGVIHTLRQQMARRDNRPNRSLADYVAPRESGVGDYIGFFAVTAGEGLEALVDEFTRAHDDYSSILAKSLADRLAEAFAERLHQRVRTELWGFVPDEQSDNDALIHERYQGIRPAPGYPACPDHTGKSTIFELLDVTAAIGMTLTESYAMHPAASVCGYYFWRPEAEYFGVGRIGRDQVEDYARRKGMDAGAVERWLAPNLGYER
jgi:5-methyltetrahydrofolate--homocysteine methyltransferase